MSQNSEPGEIGLKRTTLETIRGKITQSLLIKKRVWYTGGQSAEADKFNSEQAEAGSNNRKDPKKQEKDTGKQQLDRWTHKEPRRTGTERKQDTH